MKNEPAFPTGIFTDEKGMVVGGSNGMTLRDYFAAKAMQSLLTTANGVVGTNRYEHYVAKTAFAIADAMLKARQS